MSAANLPLPIRLLAMAALLAVLPVVLYVGVHLGAQPFVNQLSRLTGGGAGTPIPRPVLEAMSRAGLVVGLVLDVPMILD